MVNPNDFPLTKIEVSCLEKCVHVIAHVNISWRLKPEPLTKLLSLLRVQRVKQQSLGHVTDLDWGALRVLGTNNNTVVAKHLKLVLYWTSMEQCVCPILPQGMCEWSKVNTRSSFWLPQLPRREPSKVYRFFCKLQGRTKMLSTFAFLFLQKAESANETYWALISSWSRS